MSSDPRARQRRFLVVGLYLLAAAAGVCVALRPEDVRLHALLSIILAATVGFWCVLDSRILGRPLLKSLHLLIFLTWPLAAPVYLVWSRRLRGVKLALLHGAAILVFFFVAMLLAALASPHSALRASWYADMGYRALENREYGRAVSLLEHAVAIKGDEAGSWWNLGVALQGEGRIEEAAQAFQHARALGYSQSEYRKALAACKWQRAHEAQTRGNLQLAKALYHEALAFDDTQPAIWYNLAVACEASGDRRGAVEATEKACALAPANAQYRRYLEELRQGPDSEHGKR